MSKNSKRPWEMLPEEDSRQYAAFQEYLKLPPRERSIELAWKAYRGSEGEVRTASSFQSWSVRFSWVERARAWDEHLASTRLKGIEEAAKGEAKKRARDVEKLFWDAADFWEDSAPSVRAAFLDKATDEEAPHTATNQAMRIYGDFLRLFKDFVAERHSSEEDEYSSERAKAFAQELFEEAGADEEARSPEVLRDDSPGDG